MPAQQRPMLALALRLCAMLVLSSMLLLVKLSGERGIWLPEMLFWRQLIPGVIILVWLAASGGLRRLRTQRPWVHARRAFIGGTAMFLTLGVVQILPLAEASVLYQPAVRLTHVRDSQTDEILNQWRPAIGGRDHGIGDRVKGRF